MAKEKKKDQEETTNEESPGKKTKPKNNSSKDKPVKEETIEDLKQALESEKDRLLRLSAEFENYKKRNQRELDEFKKFANEMVFKQFLTVVDNLERAIISARENSENGNLLGGVELTLKEIFKLFDTFNVKPVEAENQVFDPNFHQAVTQAETDEVPENTVTAVLQKGYLLHGRLIRPAMVVVSKKPEEKTEKETEKNKEN